MSQQIRILVADDEPDLRDVITDTLLEDGYEVMTAADGGEAVEMARREQPQLAILDVNMPIVDGYEAVRRLRAAPETRGMTIILLTAHNQESFVTQAFAEGANDYLTKPFTPANLRARVQTWLLRRASSA